MNAFLASHWRPLLVGFLIGAAFITTRYVHKWAVTDLGLYAITGWVLLKDRRPWRERLPWWIPAIAGAVLAAVPWSAYPWATTAFGLRAFALGVTMRWLLPFFDARAFSVGLCAGVFWNTEALLLDLQNDRGRYIGITRYATILGDLGYLAITTTPFRAHWAWWIPGLATGILALTLSHARAAVIGVAAALLKTRQPAVYAVLVVVATVFLWFTFRNGLESRLTQWRSGVEDRIETHTGESCTFGPLDCGPGELTPFGVGAGAYLRAFEWPRPHSMYGIAAFELGVLAVVPAGLLAWSMWTRRLAIGPVLGLLALGVFDDTPLSQPEGHYLAAGVLLLAAAQARLPVRNHLTAHQATPAATSGQRIPVSSSNP